MDLERTGVRSGQTRKNEKERKYIMAANMTVVTHLLNGRRVGRFANRKTLNNDETIQEAIDGGYVVGKKDIIGASSASSTSSIPSGSTASRCPARTRSASTGRSKAPTGTARSPRPR